MGTSAIFCSTSAFEMGTHIACYTFRCFFYGFFVLLPSCRTHAGAVPSRTATNCSYVITGQPGSGSSPPEETVSSAPRRFSKRLIRPAMYLRVMSRLRLHGLDCGLDLAQAFAEVLDLPGSECIVESDSCRGDTARCRGSQQPGLRNLRQRTGGRGLPRHHAPEPGRSGVGRQRLT